MRRLNQDAKVRALKRVALFEGLSRKELVELARMSEDLEFPAGKVLCKEGEVGQEFFVLVQGEVDITRKGKRVTTRPTVEFFGEIALLEPTRRMATVTAKTPVRCFVLTRRSFGHLVNQNPSVESKILRVLARRIVDLSNDPTLA